MIIPDIEVNEVRLNYANVLMSRKIVARVRKEKTLYDKIISA